MVTRLLLVVLLLLAVCATTSFNIDSSSRFGPSKSVSAQEHDHFVLQKVHTSLAVAVKGELHVVEHGLLEPPVLSVDSLRPFNSPSH